LEELKNSPTASFNKFGDSIFKKGNNNITGHLLNNLICSSPKIETKQNRNDLISKVKNERNKKIEIILNTRLKEQKNLEKKTQMQFYNQYYSTTYSNIKDNVSLKLLEFF
jgi:hypothetical protein